MAKTRGRKPRSQASLLDLFVLALLTRGVRTSYALQQRARIPVGISVPVLTRLEDLKLVRRGEAGTRGRQEFTPTSKGTAAIRQLRASSLTIETGSIESVLRALALCRSLSKSTGAPLELLRKAIKHRKDLLAHGADRHGINPDSDELSASYCLMKTIADRSRIEAEIRTLEQISKAILK